MAPKVNTKLVETVEGEWRAIRSKADAQRRALDGDCGISAVWTIPPFMRPETDLDKEIRRAGKEVRARMERDKDEQ